MPKISKLGKSTIEPYHMIYIGLFLLEICYIILLLSPYGDHNGFLKEYYLKIKENLLIFVIVGILFLTIFTLPFIGVGWLAFIITLYRVANMCCNKEDFGNGLLYGGGRYYPDSATFFNQGHLERNCDETRAGYSSAVGDVKDKYLLKKLAECENKIVHEPFQDIYQKKLVYEKDGCGYGNWIIPEIKDVSPTKCTDYLCNGGCNKCTIQQYGNIFEMLNKPRPLYSTSLLASEMGSA